MQEYWLKPIMIVLGLFAFMMLLFSLSSVFPNVQWTTINATVISVLPWLVALGLGLSIFVAIMRR